MTKCTILLGKFFQFFCAEKQSSISKTTDIKKSEIFAEKTSCKYTAQNHKKSAQTNDIILHIFCAVSSCQIIRFMQRIIPPPSRMEMGHKFIMASAMLHKIKNFPISLPPRPEIKLQNAKKRLKIIPPKHTSISLRYEIWLQS